jgi:hypothetical protein
MSRNGGDPRIVEQVAAYWETGPRFLASQMKPGRYAG